MAYPQGLDRRITNADRIAARMSIIMASKRQPGCVPSYVTYTQLVAYYAEARRKTRETGVMHHVDHIVSLFNGGLHAPENLQVLTASANKAKSHREHASEK